MTLLPCCFTVTPIFSSSCKTLFVYFLHHFTVQIPDTVSCRSTMMLNQVPGNQILHCFVVVFSPRRQSVAFFTVQAFQHHSESSVDTKRWLWEWVCILVAVFVGVCWEVTDRNFVVCSCHSEMSIFMTCCFLSGVNSLSFRHLLQIFLHLQSIIKCSWIKN